MHCIVVTVQTQICIIELNPFYALELRYES